MDPLSTLSQTELLAHAAFLRRLARSLIEDEAAADDLVQQTWLGALDRPPRSASSLRAWLSAVLKNAARKRANREQRRGSWERRAARPERIPSTEDVVARLTEQRAVADAVLALAEPYRTVVLLRFFDELPPREIARRLDVPVETVKSRIQRALSLLRERLDHVHGGDRSAWCLALLPLAGWKIPIPVAGGPDGGATLVEVLAMSVKAKLSLVLVPLLVLLAGIGAWKAFPRGSPSNGHDESLRALTSVPESPLGSHAPVSRNSSSEAREPPGRPPEAISVSKEAVATTPLAASPEDWGTTLTATVRTPAREPVAGCTVSLARQQVLERSGRKWEHSPRIQEVSSDAEGKAVFRGLPSGSFDVSAKGRGWVGGPSTILLDGSTSDASLDLFVEATATVKGRCVDTAGAPLEDVHLFIRTEEGTPTEDVTEGDVETESGADGSFVLADIPIVDDSRTFVGATLAGFRDEIRLPVDLVPGTVADSGVLTFREPMGSARGTVSDASLTPIEGVEVYAVPVSETGQAASKETGGPSAESDAQGRFTLRGLYATTYVVRARSLCLSDSTPLRFTISSASEVVELGTVIASPGTHRILGDVEDANGRPLSGAEVHFGRRRARTDARGHFELDCCEAGTGSLFIQWRAPTEPLTLRRIFADVATDGPSLSLRLHPTGVVLHLLDASTGEPIRSRWLTISTFELGPGTTRRMGTYTCASPTVRLSDSTPGALPLLILAQGYRPKQLDEIIPEGIDEREHEITVKLERLP